MEKQDITFKIYKDYMDTGNLYSKTEITLHEGLTVLVGCNGSGKTTLLNQINDNCKKLNIRCLKFDNLHDGGSSSTSLLAFTQDFEGLAFNMMSSEGEQITVDFGRFSSKIAKAFRGTLKSDNPFVEILGKKIEYESDKLVVLLDAIDSGLSIDNMVEVKELIKNTIFKEAEDFGYHLYVVAVSNAYELARNEDCFDLWSCSYIRFKDYEDYRKYVLKTRKRKDQRIKRHEAKLEKERLNEEAKKEKEREKWNNIRSVDQESEEEIEETIDEYLSPEDQAEVDRRVEEALRNNRIREQNDNTPYVHYTSIDTNTYLPIDDYLKKKL